jgi:hypothetical protein
MSGTCVRQEPLQRPDWLRRRPAPRRQPDQPAIAERVYDTFADILTGPGDAVAQLAATAKLLRLIDHGDHPDRAVPLHRHARSILAACFPETSLPEDGPRRG